MTPEERLERYPAIDDLKKIAKKRMPHFAWEFLDSGTGAEAALDRNCKAFSNVTLVPRSLRGSEKPTLGTELFGRSYSLPLGIAPVGLSGLMWPGAEIMLAKAAARQNIPYCLSTVACETPEDVGRAAGANAWFQLYAFADNAINTDLLKRAADSGFSALVITVDVPVPSMRERQRRAGLRMPPKATPKFLLDIARRPGWVSATRKRGRPSFRTLEKYASSADMREITGFIAKQRMGAINDWNDIEKFRKLWKGPVIIKGLMSGEDAKQSVELGVDGIVVSNHGGRQMDAAPASISVLPEIVEAVSGKTKILFDSGVRSGLDIARALALGADFVLAGRPFLYGAAALGQEGADHVIDIFRTDLENNMIQLGACSISKLRDFA